GLALQNSFLNSIKGLSAVLTAGAALCAHAANPPATAPKTATDGYPFSFETLQQDAKRRASAAYSPRRSSLPSALDKLSPDQYRRIRFNPEAAIWTSDGLPFRLELLRATSNNQTAVSISTVEEGKATDVVATPAMFQMAPELPAQLGKVSLPLSGFRL